MAGLRQNGFFDRVAGGLLRRTSRVHSLVLILVFLCFFFSMLITNDVALLTFVPFSMYILEYAGHQDLLVPVVVLQTLAANLGSMLTPIGNPQNLYLYGLSAMSMGDFLILMLPYSAFTALLLLITIAFVVHNKDGAIQVNLSENPSLDDASSDNLTTAASQSRTHIHIAVYSLLFLLAILVVVRILPWTVLAGCTLVIVFFMERPILGSVDYALLLTFIGFFIFTGNMGKVPFISDALTYLVNGHEEALGILLSQAISNVPAALLLSGFTTSYRSLILGVNLGGLGTLIASMASLISYKFVAHAYNEKKGSYFAFFTVMNLVYLVLLIGLSLIIGG